MKKIELFLICTFLILGILNAQKLILSDIDKGIILGSDDDFCNVHTECSGIPKVKNPSFFFLPDGKIINLEAINCGSGDKCINFYSIDKKKCSSKLEGQLTIPKSSGYETLYQFGISDYLGRIYFTLGKIGTFDQGYVCRINNLNDKNIQYLFPFNPINEFIFDITFVMDKVYITEFRNDEIIVCDTSFNRIGLIQNIKYDVRGFVSYAVSCDSVITYAFHCSKKRIDPDQVYCTDTMFISTYDFETNTFTPVCFVKTPTTAGAFRASSLLEFLASDPECDLLIDLDRDNSSGLYPYDYRPPKTLCTERNIAIADTDLYIHTSIPLDSIVLTLHGVLDRGQEILSPTVSIAGISFYKINDTVYVLKALLNTPDSVYRKVLASIQYTHLSNAHIPGIRKIEVQGFSVVKAGVKIYSFIAVGAGFFAKGKDTTITICTDTKYSQLSDLVHAKNGYWAPLLSSGADNFDSKLDLADSYQYISGDIICGLDTAEIFIRRSIGAPAIQVALDTVVCLGDLLMFSGITYSDTGLYHFIIPSASGCDSIVYTIHLTHNNTKSVEIISNRELCEGDTILLAASNGYKEYRWYYGNVAFSTSSISKVYTPGFYYLEAIDQYNCMSHDTLQVISHPRPIIKAMDMTNLTFIQNRKVEISYEGMISKYKWEPPTGLSCSDCAVPTLLDDKDRVYDISVLSDHACTDSSHILINYKRIKYFIPNVVAIHVHSDNNIFYIHSDQDYEYSMEIFDRWGHVVFSNFNLQLNNPSGAWNPIITYTPPGVYVYKCVVNTGSGEVLKIGDVTIIK
ncbi:MAG: hypothetical protein ABI844_03125 [Saprospiraceae bacterium]